MSNNYVRKGNGYIEQLMQLFGGAKWDGDLICKDHRKQLVKSGLAVQAEGGFNLITPKGVKYLSELGLIHS